MRYTSKTILNDLRKITPFPGWELNILYPYVENRISRLDFDLLFPYGAESLISEYNDHLHDLLSHEINTNLPQELGITNKIRWMISKHFEHILNFPEAERAAISNLHYPSIALQSPTYVARLCDLIWKAAGDKSTNMNYYTKRGSLSVVYVATLLYWYTSNASIEDIMGFFDNRLENLKTITGAVKKYKVDPDNLIKNIQLLKAAFLRK